MEPSAAATPATQSKTPLFNSIDFRSPSFADWYDFSDKIAETLAIFSRCTTSAALCPRPDIAALMAEIEPLRANDPDHYLVAVNRLANRRPYKSDLMNFGQREYWASPLEFLARSGDCEDFAIFKYALLRHLGLPAEQLRIVMVYDRIRALGHAVLAIYRPDDILILDSLSNFVTSHTRYRHYVPRYSMNETDHWIHFSSNPPEADRLSVALADRDDLARPPTASRRGEAGRLVAKRRRQAKAPGGGFDPAPTATGLARPDLLGAATSDSAVQPPAVSAALPTKESGTFLVQLGAFRVPENAPAAWRRLRQTQPDILGGLQHRIRRVDLGERGVFHLLRVGPLADADAAQTLCGNLAERGIGCLAVKL